MIDQYRHVVLSGAGFDIAFTNKEYLNGDEQAWLTGLKGWFGGVGVDAEDTQRKLGHGLFASVARRTGRALTLSGTLVFKDEESRDIADRLISGLLWDGEEGQLEVFIGGEKYFSTVRLDGEISHAYKGLQSIEVQIPLLAADPLIYGVARHSQIFPSGTGEGLVYPLFTTKKDSSGSYVLDWGAGAPLSAVLTNEGNADAYPVFTVQGDFPEGFSLLWNGRVITYPAFVDQAAPVTVDCKTGAVYVNGVDQSYKLSSRQWFTVPPRSSFQPRLQALTNSDGWADVQLASTYM